MSQSDGGPAFPVDAETALQPVTDMNGNDVQSGMSLRDWFAGQALAGHMATGLFPNASQKSYPGQTNAQWAAENAYVYADAMLAERSKEQE